jgi:hypothetical protein
MKRLLLASAVLLAGGALLTATTLSFGGGATAVAATPPTCPDDEIWNATTQKCWCGYDSVMGTMGHCVGYSGAPGAACPEGSAHYPNIAGPCTAPTDLPRSACVAPKKWAMGACPSGSQVGCKLWGCE